MYRVQTTYIRGFFTGGIPLIIFFIIWLGGFFLFGFLTHWKMPGWLYTLLFLGLPILALLINVFIYPYLYHLASAKQKEVILEGSYLTISSGRKEYKIDLNYPYYADIRAGSTGTGEQNWLSVNISQNKKEVYIHLSGIRREQVIEAFPDSFFVGTMPITPYEGTWGFVMDATTEGHSEISLALLKELWRTYGNNKRYQIFQKFPWYAPPSPAFTHIKVLKAEDRNTEAFLLAMEIDQTSGWVVYPWLKLTKDYLIANQGTAEYPLYYLMPLGYISADAKKTATSKDVWAELVIRGNDEKGKETTVKLDWPRITHPEWEEAQMCEEFINSRPAIMGK